MANEEDLDDTLGAGPDVEGEQASQQQGQRQQQRQQARQQQQPLQGGQDGDDSSVVPDSAGEDRQQSSSLTNFFTQLLQKPFAARLPKVVWKSSGLSRESNGSDK